METSKRLSISIDGMTEMLVAQLLSAKKIKSQSELFRTLVQEESERLKIISNEKGSDTDEGASVDFTEIYKKFAALMTAVSSIDTKAYVLLDCFNNFLRFTEIENGVDYKSIENSASVHPFCKASMDNLAEVKRRAQLNRI